VLDIPIGVGTLIGYVVVPAVLFGMAYFPIVTFLARGLASRYAKVDLRRRFFAAGVDASLVMTGVVLFTASGALPFLIGAAIYVPMRDAIAGRSVGKFLLGLVVIQLETGRPAGPMVSLRRNLLFLLPGANLVAVGLESLTIVRDPQGQRLGDRLAQTQVVDGFAAKEAARAFAEWWRRFVPEATRSARPRRGPALPMAHRPRGPRRRHAA
jgi:hypothetical protein